MGTLFGFAVGYIVGARGGREGFDEVVDALRAVRESEEFHGFVQVLTDHLRGSAAILGRWLTAAEADPADEMLARARQRAERD
jgi:hypothetical protein